MSADFRPGDVVIANGRWKHHTRYVVADPVRTSRGKLRLRTQGGTITTAWWRFGALPAGFTLTTERDAT